MVSLVSLTHLLLAYKYAILFPAAVFEGPIITVVAGALLSLGFMSPVPAYLIIVVGDTVGDYLHYAVGRYGGKKFIDRWGKYVGLNERHVASLEKMFDGREGRVFTFGKLAHGFGGALLVAAGMIRMSVVKFLYWNILGTLPKTLALLLIGYYFAHAVTNVGSALDVVASATVVLGLIATFIWLRIYGRKRDTNV